MNPLDYLRDKRGVLGRHIEGLIAKPLADAQPRHELVIVVPPEGESVGRSADDLEHGASDRDDALSVARLIHGGIVADHEPVLDVDGWFCADCGADLDLVS